MVWRLPKLELLAQLQTLLETKRPRIAERMREAGERAVEGGRGGRGNNRGGCRK